MKFLGAALLATILATASFASEGTRITVTGEGRVEATPDMATISLGVTAEAETAREAMDQVSEGVTALMAALGEAGIEARDIQTSGLSLNPLWHNASFESGPPEITGFTASNMVTIRVQALEGLGEVLDGLLDAGANTFNRLTFGLQDPEPKLDDARVEAVADARRKAEILAAAAGVSLGRIIEITEASDASVPMQMFRMRANDASGGMPIAGGEMEVTARVIVTWEIGD